MENQNQNIDQKEESKFKIWLKRVGIGGLIFFTVKGIVWLFIIFWAGKCTVG